MARQLASRAEVLGRCDNSLSNHVQPDSVDHDPRGQGVFLVANPPGQFQATAGATVNLDRSGSEDLRKTTWDHLCRLIDLATHQQPRVCWRLGFLDSHAIAKRITVTVHRGQSAGQGLQRVGQADAFSL